MKSGKSTDSFAFLGKSYRFFEEIRRVKIGCAAPNFASLKTTSSLSKFTQTWREKPANSSDMVRFSGKLFRHDNKTRLLRCVGPGCCLSHVYRKSRLPQVALCAEVGLANVIVVQEFLASSVLSNLAKLKNVRAVSNLKCHVSVLLDQQNGGSCIA